MGNSTTLVMQSTDTIWAMKQRIQDSAGYPIEAQCLFRNGNWLADACTLAYSDIRHKDVVDLMLEQRGC